MKPGKVQTTAVAILIFALALLYVFPVLYMVLSGFKTEAQAVYPKLFFVPTLKTYQNVFQGWEMLRYLKNSLFQVFWGTALSLLLGIPAAFVLVFGRFHRSRETAHRIHSWFITTILLPPVAVIIPLFTWFQKFHLIGTPWGLLLAYIGFHIPIVVWMLHSFFADIPQEILESAALDGCPRLGQLIYIAIPLVKIGIATTALLVCVFIWNEFFLGFNLTGNRSATLPVYMSRFREQQGQFVAQLSASSTIAVLPPVVLGWLTQKSLVKGLTIGAVKG